MPELPEVETIARTLQAPLTGRRLVSCQLLNQRTLDGKIPLSAALGGIFSLPCRRGKILLLPFEQENTGAHESTPGGSEKEAAWKRWAKCQDEKAVLGLGIHLKMTGRVFVHPAGTQAGPHTRAILDLDNGSRLFFDDARKFGYLRVLTPAVLKTWPFWIELGPEPLELTPKDFAECFHNRNAAIKALLLNQKILAGCGNIYADESLFRAGIHPAARKLSPIRLKKLGKALHEVLLEAIAACGSSIRDYRTAQGDKGSFQNKFRVYGRAGQNCLVCGEKLLSARIAGRGTVFCPNCQTS